MYALIRFSINSSVRTTFQLRQLFFDLYCMLKILAQLINHEVWSISFIAKLHHYSKLDVPKANTSRNTA